LKEEQNLMANAVKLKHFLEAIKVIEIIKVKESCCGVEFDFDVSALRKKMIIENTFSPADPVTKIYLGSPV
jgi:acetylornithine aminotransferase